MHQVLLVGLQRDLRHSWDQAADRETIRTHRKILVKLSTVFQPHSVNHGEGAFEQRFGDLESDEIVVLLRSITILGDLHGIEAELDLQVGCLILRITNRLAKLRPQLWILDGDGLG